MGLKGAAYDARIGLTVELRCIDPDVGVRTVDCTVWFHDAERLHDVRADAAVLGRPAAHGVHESGTPLEPLARLGLHLEEVLEGYVRSCRRDAHGPMVAPGRHATDARPPDRG